MLLIISLGYALIYRSNPTRFVTLMRCANDSNLTDQLFRENNRIVHQTLALLSGMGACTIGALVAWSAFRLGHLGAFSSSSLFFGILAALSIVMFRFTVLSGIGTVFGKASLIDHVLYLFWVILAFIGPALIPIVALAAFGPHLSQPFFIWLGLGVIGISYVVFLVRSLLITLKEKGIGPLNLIYYFCALEIMPVLVAYRTLLS